MRLPRLPRALLWDHNAHYHAWLMRRLPAGCGRALDVGCGAGALARRLAARAGAVDAVDRSEIMIGRARAAGGASNLSWLLGDVLDASLPLDAGGYDAVTAVSSLHHMPLRPALARLSALVRPGGVLLAVGCYRPAAFGDHLVDALAVPANLAVGVVLAARGRAGKPHDEDMPVVWPPDTTLAEIRDAAAELLPGSRVRRLLFFRYGLERTRPGSHPPRDEAFPVPPTVRRKPGRPGSPEQTAAPPDWAAAPPASADIPSTRPSTPSWCRRVT